MRVFRKFKSGKQVVHLVEKMAEKCFLFDRLDTWFQFYEPAIGKEKRSGNDEIQNWSKYCM